MFLVIFRFANGDTPNYVGPFKDWREADYFRGQWVNTFTKEEGEMEIIRFESPKTPDQYAK